MPFFRIKDLMVNVLSDGRGPGLCVEEASPTIPTDQTPIANVIAMKPVLEHFANATKSVGDDADVLLDKVALHVGRNIVLAAAQAGGVFYPDPNCGGTSYETIPPTITPWVHTQVGLLHDVHISDLRAELALSIEQLDVAEQQALDLARKAGVKSQLEAGIKALG